MFFCCCCCWSATLLTTNFNKFHDLSHDRVPGKLSGHFISLYVCVPHSSFHVIWTKAINTAVLLLVGNIRQTVGASCVTFGCFSQCLCGFFLPHAKDKHARLTDDSKSALCVNVCLFLCISPVTNWKPLQGFPRLLSRWTWMDGLILAITWMFSSTLMSNKTRNLVDSTLF